VIECDHSNYPFDEVRLQTARRVRAFIEAETGVRPIVVRKSHRLRNRFVFGARRSGSRRGSGCACGPAHPNRLKLYSSHSGFRQFAAASRFREPDSGVCLRFEREQRGARSRAADLGDDDPLLCGARTGAI
jgi:hypothetical protein